ncbi:hypothetical protein [Ornithinimicrobium sp. Y1694]|uniref:hypothetical protein n=1 Tax=Ornithinimicrobium sp. Y1694 TaxID=3418590 RepID=UPI003CF57501
MLGHTGVDGSASFYVGAPPRSPADARRRLDELTDETQHAGATPFLADDRGTVET